MYFILYIGKQFLGKNSQALTVLHSSPWQKKDSEGLALLLL